MSVRTTSRAPVTVKWEQQTTVEVYLRESIFLSRHKGKIRTHTSVTEARRLSDRKNPARETPNKEKGQEK